MTKRKKIKATYRNGVIELLDKINLPEGQALEIEFKVLLKTPHELSREEKRDLIEKMSGSMKGTWETPSKKLMLISSQKDNHGIENFRFPHSTLLIHRVCETAALIERKEKNDFTALYCTYPSKQRMVDRVDIGSPRCYVPRTNQK